MHVVSRAPWRAWVACVLLLPVAGACAGAAPGGTAPSPRERTAADAHPAGSVATIDEAELQRIRFTRVEELLNGRVPGLYVIRTGTGGYTLRVRGLHTFQGSGEPLLVIDGMPIRSGGLEAALAGLNPTDLSRVEVLKDAGATGSYGVQGANGVVLITTRRRH